VKNTTPINTPKTRRESRMWLGKAAKVDDQNWRSKTVQETAKTPSLAAKPGDQKRQSAPQPAIKIGNQIIHKQLGQKPTPHSILRNTFHFSH
jgi:hypothetical protein